MQKAAGAWVLVTLALATSVTACDASLRIGSGAASAGSDAGELPPGVTLFAADAGADASVAAISGLMGPDSSVDRSGWILDPMAGVTVSTVAGGPAPGHADGLADQAQFNNPVSLALEPSGSMLVTDFDNGLVRRVTPAGEVTTVVQPGTFERPFGIAFAGSTLYVQTEIDPIGDHSEYTGTVWRVDPATGAARAIAVDIGRPRGMVALPDGKLLLSDYMMHTVRELDPQTGDLSSVAGMTGSAAFADAPGSNARFNEAYGIARLPSGEFLVADRLNHRIRQVTKDGVTSTFAGDGVKGMRDGLKGQARFNGPKAVAVDAAGNVYVTDCGNRLVRRIDRDGRVMTVAGDGTPGAQDGDGRQARFYGIEGLVVTENGRTLYVADGTNGEDRVPFHRLRRIALP